MSLTAIIDYGMGNIRSVQKACEFLGYTTKLVHEPEELIQADHVILPGVGAFGDAMTELKKSGFDEALHVYAATGKPLLGICLGMQLFFESSTEGQGESKDGGQGDSQRPATDDPLAGHCDGLGLFPGTIRRFPASLPVKIPHIGWNEVMAQPGQSRLFAHLPANFSTYFVHSYRFDQIKAPFAAGITQHGEPFVAAIEKDNIMATQFHPEKSGIIGLKILENFLRLS